MDIWRDIREEIKQYDYNADSRYEKATYINDQLNEIMKTNEDLQDKPPPLFVIIHTLKGIMYPQFLPDLMSEFLHQFTLVELYRLKATEKAALALKMNEALGEEEGYLTDEKKTIFNVAIEDQQGMRDLYIKVLTTCIFIDLQQRWVDSSNIDFWIRWNEYLSFLRGPKGTTETHNFQFTLSDDEVARLRALGIRFSKFTVDSTKWAQQHWQGQTLQEILESSLFRKEFPCPAVPIMLIKYYLDSVLGVVDALETCGHKVFDIDQ